MSDICVFGAGSIGCYVGGRLAAGGANLSFIGRPRIGKTLQSHGLQLSDYRGYRQQLKPQQLVFGTDAGLARSAELILVTVKSAASAEAALALAPVLKPGAVVLSLQNGLSNAAVLKQHLPGQRVIAGMVPFNVVNQGQGRFHQGSEGTLDVAADAALQPFVQDFNNAGLPLLAHQDMPAVLWAKLLLNLNNAINALSGLPLREELAQRPYRQCLAAAQRETLDLLDQAGIRPARLTPLPASWIPRLLDVPDALFARLANKMLEIDPLARSSMWEDLEQGRPTEIDYINGEVIALARRQQRQAPINAALVELIREAENGGRRDWTGAELKARLRAAGPAAGS